MSDRPSREKKKGRLPPREVPRIQVYPSRSAQYPLRRWCVCSFVTMVLRCQGSDDDYTTHTHTHHLLACTLYASKPKTDCW